LMVVAPTSSAPAEDEGKAQDVVDLIGKIAAPGGDDGIRRDLADLVGQDFRIGIGQRQDERVRAPSCATIAGVSTPGPTGPGRRRRPRSLRQRGGGGFAGKGAVSGRHLVGAAVVDQPFHIAEVTFSMPDAQLDQHLEAGHAPPRRRRSSHDLDVLEAACRQDKCIAVAAARRRRWRCRAGRHGRPESSSARAQLFDHETFRRLDVFQVDAAEGRLQRADDVDQLVDIGFGSLNSRSNTSMPANFLNRTALPSITGLDASGPILPRPSTAVPLVMTATRLPRDAG
jgi:hypothetical protein